MSASEDARSRARHSAMKMLALREHSEHELLRKLIAKNHDAVLAEQVVVELKTENLVSNERFVEVFVRSKTERGLGPLRIQQELQQHDLDSNLTDGAIDIYAPFWIEKAARARRKKFGEQIPSEFKDWARQVRFLQTRGYTMEQIQSLKKFEFENEWD